MAGKIPPSKNSTGKKHLSQDQWAAIRITWEDDPLLTYDQAAKLASDAGKFRMPSRPSICGKAKKEQWNKRGQLAGINEKADRLADSFTNSNGESNGKPSVFTPDNIASRYESEGVRAAVKVRMRAEWAELEGFRKTALKVMKDAHDAWKKEMNSEAKAEHRALWQIAKIAADTALANIRALSVKQEGEARAWGLDIKTEEEIIITNPRRAEA